MFFCLFSLTIATADEEERFSIRAKFAIEATLSSQLSRQS